MRPKKAATRDLGIRVVSMVVVVALDSEVAFLSVGTLCVNHINLRVNLVNPFRQNSRLLIEVSLF